MAETVRSLRVQVIITGTVVGDDGAFLTVSEQYDKTFGDGTGTDQVGTVWQDKSRNLNATSEDLDLDALTDFQGATMSSLANIGMLYFRNLDEDAADSFTLGGAAAQAWEGGTTPFFGAGDKISVGAGGVLLWISPVDKGTIGAGTADTLKVEAADNSDYRLIFAGDNA
jgi:hypothetical protein